MWLDKVQKMQLSLISLISDITVIYVLIVITSHPILVWLPYINSYYYFFKLVNHRTFPIHTTQVHNVITSNAQNLSVYSKVSSSHNPL